MKVFVVDISGRNFAQYNPSLCRSLKNKGGDDIYLLSNTIKDENPNYNIIGLIRIVPKRFAGSENSIKRVLRGIEVLLNYFYIIFLVSKYKPDIVHMQWLPLVELAKLESFFLKSFKRANKNVKIFLTVHNMYPHDTPDNTKYRINFISVTKHVDGFIVHLDSSKVVLHNEFNIPLEKIFVSYHGIYKHESSCCSPIDEKGVVKIILYGLQKWYKGADILVEALKIVPIETFSKIRVTIVGVTDPDLYTRYNKIASELNIRWINEYISDEELNKMICESTLILLPYRNISQSGVLLLALSYMKPILTSNLDSFKETLEGYPDDYFFESENPQSLAFLLERFVQGKIDIEKQKEIIKYLNKKYSWEETAKSTYDAYNCIINKA